MSLRLLAIVALLIFPVVALGAVLDPAGIVPCGNKDTICHICEITLLAQNIINFAVYLATALAAILFMYAGFKYATASANPGQIEEAHKIFWNVLIGMVFVLGAWLIVDTIMKALFDEGNKGFGPWNELQCTLPYGGDVDYSKVSTEGFSGLEAFSREQLPYTISAGNLSEKSIDQGLAKTSAYNSYIQASLDKYDVPEEEALALIVAESGGDPSLVNGDSVGLMQVRLGTARSLNFPNAQSVTDNQVEDWLLNPKNNVEAGMAYYAGLREQFSDPDLAAAAYNGGPGANLPSKDCDGLLRWQCPYDSRLSNGQSCYGTGLTGCKLNEGYKETRAYVSKIKQVREYVKSRQ